MAAITEEDVGQYLREHPQFLASWFLEHADDDTLQVVARKMKQDVIFHHKHQPDRAMGRTSEEKTESIGSMSEESLIIDPSEDRKLQKYASFSKVGRNSITSMIFRKYLDGDRTRRPSVKKDLDDLKRMSEEELFMELIRDIASELDVNVLCHKILQNVSILTNSDRGSLFLVRGSRDNKYLVSKLFDVTESSTLEQSIHTEANEITVPFGVGIAGNVAKSREAINIKDVYADPRFNQEVDKKTGYRTHSILSMPIVNYEGEVIGVAQIINKISGNHEFSKQDEDLLSAVHTSALFDHSCHPQLFRKYLTFCGIGITNAQLFEMSVNEFKRNQITLYADRSITRHNLRSLSTLTKAMQSSSPQLCPAYVLKLWKQPIGYIHNISKKFAYFHLNRFTKFCTLSLQMNTVVKFAMGVKLSTWVSIIYNGYVKIQIPNYEPREVRCAKASLIAKVTVVEGEVRCALLIAKVTFYDHDVKAKSVLCMPIHNSDRTIIGVTQLINKVNGQPFDDNDEHIIEAFSIFTGLGIHNCQMYENACQLMAKQSVALEVLSYHATASKEEAERIMSDRNGTTDVVLRENSFEKIVETIPTADDYRLYTYDFDDMSMTDDDTIKATIRMFLDANLISQFKIPYETMCRWVCTVKKNYRPVTYHNWRHAFNVCQTMFTMLYTGELRPKFDAVEVFALMAACLCHDLDHRGTNNAFQVKVASPLAMLYSTSVLEHHHFDHCIMIINSEGNNIFQSFPPEEYRRAIKILEHAILSTDLALYFKKRGDFKALVEGGEKEFHDEDKKDLLKAMMMTACDVAAITKPWRIQKEIAQLVTAEFFEQGDIEKTQLGEKPIPMMDREKKDELPKMQVDFIDFICAPVYQAFANMFPRLAPFYEGVISNRQSWSELANNKELADRELSTQAKEPITNATLSPFQHGKKLSSDKNEHKISSDRDGHKSHSKSNIKKAPRSPKLQRSPMLVRKSPLAARRLSEPPPLPDVSRKNVQSLSKSKLASSSREGAGVAVRSKNQGRSTAREGH
ncbi:unnamed protein product, partial [Lymnaea stagnalis]